MRHKKNVKNVCSFLNLSSWISVKTKHCSLHGPVIMCKEHNSELLSYSKSVLGKIDKFWLLELNTAYSKCFDLS